MAEQGLAARHGLLAAQGLAAVRGALAEQGFHAERELPAPQGDETAAGWQGLWPAAAGFPATAVAVTASTAPRAVRDLLRNARLVVDIGLDLSSRCFKSTDVRPSPKFEMPMMYGFDSEKLSRRPSRMEMCWVDDVEESGRDRTGGVRLRKAPSRSRRGEDGDCPCGDRARLRRGRLLSRGLLQRSRDRVNDNA